MKIKAGIRVRVSIGGPALYGQVIRLACINSRDSFWQVDCDDGSSRAYIEAVLHPVRPELDKYSRQTVSFNTLNDAIAWVPAGIML